MAFDPLSAAFELGNSVINKIWPDPVKQAEEQRKLAELYQNGDLEKLNAHVQLMLKQADINLQDAKSNNWFQASWRPAIGWVGAISLALMYIPKAIVQTYIWTYQAITILDDWNGVAELVVPAFPDLGVGDVIGLLMSMLGVAAMRSFDKVKNTDTK
ncbi:hypothetical protein VPPG_00015 [Vibrio phage VD1]|nr:hypothetical protein VPPG_00015 [Vibrio phage VD1]